MIETTRAVSRQVEYLYGTRCPSASATASCSRARISRGCARASTRSCARRRRCARGRSGTCGEQHAALRQDTAAFDGRNRFLDGRGGLARMTMLTFGEDRPGEDAARAHPEEGHRGAQGFAARDGSRAPGRARDGGTRTSPGGSRDSTRATARNTEVLNAVSDLHAKTARAGGRRLKRTQSGVYVDPDAARRTRAAEREQMAAIVEAQAAEINTLREEIGFLSVEGTPARPELLRANGRVSDRAESSIALLSSARATSARLHVSRCYFNKTIATAERARDGGSERASLVIRPRTRLHPPPAGRAGHLRVPATGPPARAAPSAAASGARPRSVVVDHALQLGIRPRLEVPCVLRGFGGGRRHLQRPRRRRRAGRRLERAQLEMFRVKPGRTGPRKSIAGGSVRRDEISHALSAASEAFSRRESSPRATAPASVEAHAEQVWAEVVRRRNRRRRRRLLVARRSGDVFNAQAAVILCPGLRRGRERQAPAPIASGCGTRPRRGRAPPRRLRSGGAIGARSLEPPRKARPRPRHPRGCARIGRSPARAEEAGETARAETSVTRLGTTRSRVRRAQRNAVPGSTTPVVPPPPRPRAKAHLALPPASAPERAPGTSLHPRRESPRVPPRSQRRLATPPPALPRPTPRMRRRRRDPPAPPRVRQPLPRRARARLRGRRSRASPRPREARELARPEASVPRREPPSAAANRMRAAAASAALAGARPTPSARAPRRAASGGATPAATAGAQPATHGSRASANRLPEPAASLAARRRRRPRASRACGAVPDRRPVGPRASKRSRVGERARQDGIDRLEERLGAALSDEVVPERSRDSFDDRGRRADRRTRRLFRRGGRLVGDRRSRHRPAGGGEAGTGAGAGGGDGMLRVRAPPP